MTKLYLAIGINVVMLALIPFHSLLATKASAPLYTHLVYMFGHANILHWLINAWAIMTLHKIISARMAAVAYSTAVILSFFINQPTVGASAMIFFVFGCLTPTLAAHNRVFLLQIAIFLVAAFFIPNIAASLHLAAYIIGIGYIGACKITFQLKRLFNENQS